MDRLRSGAGPESGAMKRLIVPALLVAAFLAGGMAPAHALGEGSMIRALEKMADSLREIARNSDRKVEVECSCRCEK